MADEVVPGGAGLGDRFVALLGRPDGDGWSPADAIFGSALDATLDAVASARGADSPAVAGALLVEQYALRLAAPVVAAYAREAAVLDARPTRVSALVVDGAVRRLAFDRPPQPGAIGPAARHTTATGPAVGRGGPATSSSGRAAVGGSVTSSAGRAAAGGSDAVAASLREGIEPVAAAVHRSTRVGLRTLRGAMANAVANAFLHLSWPCADRARYLADAEAVLAAAGWSALVRLRDVDGWMYTDRNTCCLAFRTSVNRGRDQHYCLTCPITPRETTLASFREATADYSRRHPR